MKNNKNLSLRSVRIVKINRLARAKAAFEVSMTVIEREKDVRGVTL
jgi:hypothetical protein